MPNANAWIYLRFKKKQFVHRLKVTEQNLHLFSKKSTEWGERGKKNSPIMHCVSKIAHWPTEK